MRFRGREMAHQILASTCCTRVRDDLEELSKIEQFPKMEGQMVVLSPVTTVNALPPSPGMRGSLQVSL